MRKSKQEVIKETIVLNRLNKVYCRLKPSPIHGVGIFAIRPIPKGINPFKDSYMAQEAILVEKSKISEEFKQLLTDYHPSNIASTQIVSNYPNQPIWTNYLNYSNDPNIQLMENGEWITLRPISVDEELLEDPKRLFKADGTHKTFSVALHQYPSIIP